MSKGCRFQTRSFPSRVPKGTRRFLMRRPTVYYSNKGIYFDDRLIFLYKHNHTCNKHNIITPEKYSGAWIKQHNHNIVWTQTKYANPTRGLRRKQILKAQNKKTRSKRCSGAEGQNPSQNNCAPYTPLGNTLGGLKHKQTSYIQTPLECARGLQVTIHSHKLNIQY